MPESHLKLIVFCEGDTEYYTLKDFLSPYWTKRFKSCKPINMGGNAKLKNRFLQDAKDFLEDPNNYVLCLVDLFEEPFQLSKTPVTHAENYELIRKFMYFGIPETQRERFGGFPVMMELETWLLADSDVMAYIGKKCPIAPENIEHPAEFLKGAWQTDPTRSWTKGDTVLKLYRRASAERVYQDNCPHFNQIADWITGKITSAPLQPPSVHETQNREFQALEQTIEEKRKLRDQADDKALTSGLLEDLRRSEQLDAEIKSLEQQLNDLLSKF